MCTVKGGLSKFFCPTRTCIDDCSVAAAKSRLWSPPSCADALRSTWVGPAPLLEGPVKGVPTDSKRVWTHTSLWIMWVHVLILKRGGLAVCCTESAGVLGQGHGFQKLANLR